MIFETNEYEVDFVKQEDLEECLSIYNSNFRFLHKHMDKGNVTSEWLNYEVTNMNEFGFKSCKIINKSSGKIIGIMDYKLDLESYLSLLMIHNDYKGKGIGSLIYQGFEEFTKSLNCNCIRIDVVIDYNIL